MFSVTFMSKSALLERFAAVLQTLLELLVAIMQTFSTSLVSPIVITVKLGVTIEVH
jgi:hypothetical protein